MQIHASKQQDMGIMLSNCSGYFCTWNWAFILLQCCDSSRKAYVKAYAVCGCLVFGELVSWKPADSCVASLCGSGGSAELALLVLAAGKCRKIHQILQKYLPWVVLPPWWGKVVVETAWKDWPVLDPCLLDCLLLVIKFIFLQARTTASTAIK